MNYLITRKIEDFEKVSNPVEKVIKTKYCLEFLIIYYASIFYNHTKLIEKVNKDMIEIIQCNFYKKIHY